MRDKASISILPALCLWVLVPCTGTAATRAFRRKFTLTHEVPQGGSCGVVSNLCFVVDPDTHRSDSLRQLSPRCSPTAVLEPPPWASCVCDMSQPPGLSGHRLQQSPIPNVLKRTGMFSFYLWRKWPGLSLLHCSPKRWEKLQDVALLIIRVSPVRTR